jgi:hypothetical protein
MKALLAIIVCTLFLSVQATTNENGQQETQERATIVRASTYDFRTQFYLKRILSIRHQIVSSQFASREASYLSVLFFVGAAGVASWRRPSSNARLH